MMIDRYSVSKAVIYFKNHCNGSGFYLMIRYLSNCLLLVNDELLLNLNIASMFY